MQALAEAHVPLSGETKVAELTSPRPPCQPPSPNLDRIGEFPVSWGVYSVTRCHAWSAGRTAIVGDAAHAQTPNLGQGGGMAMQNG